MLRQIMLNNLEVSGAQNFFTFANIFPESVVKFLYKKNLHSNPFLMGGLEHNFLF